jgi:hypothetical protein
MQLQTSKSLFSRDITLFCTRQFDDLVEEGILPASVEDQRDVLIHRLVNGADGMFLWARLMTQFLRSPALTPAQRLRTIREINFPEGLEKIYDRILLLISQAGRTSQNLAAKIFLWLTYCKTPMSSKQIHQAFVVEGAPALDHENETIIEFEDAVIMTCGGLVERFPMDSVLPSQKGTCSFRFIHISIKEMLAEPTEAPLRSVEVLNSIRPLLPVHTTANLCLAVCCLRQIVYHTPAQPLAGKLNESIPAASLHENFPFTDYASVYWISHLKDSMLNASIASACPDSPSSEFENNFGKFTALLSTFLSKPETPTAWLESFYTAVQYQASSTNLAPAGSILEEWSDWATESSSERQALMVDERLVQDTQAFGRDLDKITKQWGHHLARSPATVWNEMTGFSPSRFFFSPHSVKYASRPPEKAQIPGISDHRLASISRVSSDGKLLGVLSIWPPEYVNVTP